MSMSPQALEAIEAIRRDLRIRISLSSDCSYYDSPPKLRVIVELTLEDDVICSAEDFIDVPD